MHKKVLTFNVILILVLTTASAINAQTQEIWNESRCAELKSLIQDLHDNKRFNGTVLIAENGKAKFHESFGFSDVGDNKKLDTEASFRLASVSKQFTAMAIMMLKEQGKLSYDDPITKHLPSLPYSTITIRHLLHHTSGLPDYMMLMNKHWEKGKKFSDRKVAFNQDAVATFAEHKPELNFEPGSKFSYSNTGYVFLGQIIENASKMPVRQFIKKNILQRIGMSNSDVFGTGPDFKLKHRVFGFRNSSKEPFYIVNDHHYLNGMVGDGGIYATALDLLKWDQALYGEKLVGAKTLQEAFTSGKLNDQSETEYGFGWIIDSKPESNRFLVNHSGGWVGFSTFIARDISNRRTLIVLENSSSGIRGVLSKISDVKKDSIGDK